MSTTRTEKELEQELKNRGDEEKHDNFILAVRRKEMLTEEKMSGSKKKGEQEHIRHFHKTCN